MNGLDWLKKETVECTTENLDYNINQLLTKYKTQVVLLKRQARPNEKYKLEVWYNFDSGVYLVNVVYVWEEN